MEERQMTIAKGLGRIKTLTAQLDDIRNDIIIYAAWNSKKKCPLGVLGNDSTKATAIDTINVAQEKINSLYQQYVDLLNEMLTLRRCIDNTNAVTNITVAGKTMTIHDALIYKKDIVQHYDMLTKYVINTFSKVERETETYNNNFNMNQNLSENDKKLLQADVIYLVGRNKIEELRKFSTNFVSEINDELNAVNAITQIIFN